MLGPRKLSARPELLVDQHGRQLSDGIPNAEGGAYVTDFIGPAEVTEVPQSQQLANGPLSRERLVHCLPTNEAGHGPVQLRADTVLIDPEGIPLSDGIPNALGGAYVVDLLGEPTGLWVHRMVYAARTLKTYGQ